MVHIYGCKLSGFNTKSQGFGLKYPGSWFSTKKSALQEKIRFQFSLPTVSNSDTKPYQIQYQQICH